MDPGDRGWFVAAYSKLVADVWSDPELERQLDTEPRALLAGYGLVLPDEVRLRIVRDAEYAEPDLDAQVNAWLQATEAGEFALVVPRMAAVDTAELTEYELDNVVAGLDASCACCCPCCCT